jgi:nonsense-mediated mRNA decay protein 3
LFETIWHLRVIFNYDFQVARESDLGFNDKTFHIRTHLGHLLKPGDMALGYDMVRYASSGGIEANTWFQHLSKGRDRSSTVNVSDVILVKKCFEDDLKKKVNTKKKSRRRTRPKKEGIDVAHEQIVDDSTLEAVDDSTLEGVNESNFFSFANAVDELSVVNEELSDYDDVDDNFEEDDPDEDVTDLEGLFSHLIDRNVDKQK